VRKYDLWPAAIEPGPKLPVCVAAYLSSLARPTARVVDWIGFCGPPARPGKNCTRRRIPGQIFAELPGV